MTTARDSSSSRVRCVVLVIASGDKPYYLEHRRTWRRFMNASEDVKAYFVEAKDAGEVQWDDPGNRIVVPCPGGERFDMIFAKTALAMAAVRERFDCDYVVRTNLSTVWVWDNLIRFLDGKPPMAYVAATPCVTHDGIKFPSGCGMVLSWDVVDWILEASAHVPHDTASMNDDVYIGWLLKPHPGLRFDSLPRVDVCGKYDSDAGIDESQLRITTSQWLPMDAIHIRNRLWNERHRETIETENARVLVSRYYAR